MRPNMALQTIQVQDQEFQVDVYEIGERFKELQAFISKTFKAEPKQSKECIIVPAEQWDMYLQQKKHKGGVYGFVDVKTGIIHIPTNATFKTIIHEMLHLYDYLPINSILWGEGLTEFATQIILKLYHQKTTQSKKIQYNVYAAIIETMQLWSGMDPISFVSAYYNRQIYGQDYRWHDMLKLLLKRLNSPAAEKYFNFKNAFKVEYQDWSLPHKNYRDFKRSTREQLTSIIGELIEAPLNIYDVVETLVCFHFGLTHARGLKTAIQKMYARSRS